MSSNGEWIHAQMIMMYTLFLLKCWAPQDVADSDNIVFQPL